MELYLLKSTLCLGILYVFYKAVLEVQNMHQFKRFYLLGAVALSLLIPLITFKEYVTPVILEPITVVTSSTTVPGAELASSWSVSSLLWIVYVIGVLYFLLKFILNFVGIIKRIRSNPKLKRNRLFHVLLSAPTVPHTFWSYIFLNKVQFEAQEIPEEVIQHEQAHAQERHSVDVLFIELIQILLWWNPLVYFFKNSIKLNHEFLADRAVLQQSHNPSNYQNLLLAFSSNAQTSHLANSINYSLIKKRFTVMKTQTSKFGFWLRTLCVVPVLALLIYGFSGREVIAQESNTFTYENQEEANPKQIAMYNAWAKRLNANPDNMFIKKGELSKMKYIYGIMTAEQRSKAEPFPNIPPPPPPPAPDPDGPNKATPAPNGANTWTEDPNAPPPPPPPPPDPLDHIIKMAKKGATFYYEGQAISSDEAIKILKKNKKLNVQVIDENSKKPTVKITSKPIYLRSKSSGAATYPATDPAAPIIDLAEKGAHFYITDKKVDYSEAVKLIRQDREIPYKVKKVANGQIEVHFIGC